MKRLFISIMGNVFTDHRARMLVHHEHKDSQKATLGCGRGHISLCYLACMPTYLSQAHIFLWLCVQMTD